MAYIIWSGIALITVSLIYSLVKSVVLIYNAIIEAKNKVIESHSEISVQEKRRFDLVPNIVGAVSAYAGHESQTLVSVTQARGKVMAATTPEEKSAAQGLLAQALAGLSVVVEKYPELKANEGYLKIQGQLDDIESHIQSARSYYNGSLRSFLSNIQKFPNNLIAKRMEIPSFEFFKTDDTSLPVVKW